MPARLLGLTLLVLTPSSVWAAPRNFQELAEYLVLILDNATAVLIVLGLVVYFYGISTNILKMKDEGSEKIKAYFFWGVIVLFVMVSVWGILRIIQNSLFGSDAVAPNGQQGSSGQESVFFPPPFRQ